MTYLIEQAAALRESKAELERELAELCRAFEYNSGLAIGSIIIFHSSKDDEILPRPGSITKIDVGVEI